MRVVFIVPGTGGVHRSLAAQFGMLSFNILRVLSPVHVFQTQSAT
jgi:hypothetical protein